MMAGRDSQRMRRQIIRLNTGSLPKFAWGAPAIAATVLARPVHRDRARRTRESEQPRKGSQGSATRSVSVKERHNAKNAA
jgi:hypothetical protein